MILLPYTRTSFLARCYGHFIFQIVLLCYNVRAHVSIGGHWENIKVRSPKCELSEVRVYEKVVGPRFIGLDARWPRNRRWPDQSRPYNFAREVKGGKKKYGYGRYNREAGWKNRLIFLDAPCYADES